MSTWYVQRRLREVLRTTAATLSAAVALLIGSAMSPSWTLLLVAGGLAVYAASIFYRYAVALMIVFVPVQQLLLASAYRLGAPAGFVRAVGFYKEAVLAGMILAVVRHGPRAKNFRGVDLACIAFLGLAVCYAIVPLLRPGFLGDQPIHVIVPALRLNILFVLLFMAARHLSWRPGDLGLTCRLFLGSAVFGGLFCCWESFFNASFTSFVNNFVGYGNYQREVLGLTNVPPVFGSTRSDVGGILLLRAGGPQFSALGGAFILVVPVALAFALCVQGRRPMRAFAVYGVVLAGLALTLTRSAVFAAVVASLLVGAVGTSRRWKGRALVAFGAFSTAVLFGPAIMASSLGTRIGGALTGGDASTGIHQQSSSKALAIAIRTPLGRGLGSNPGTSQLSGNRIGITSENAYLQIALELGLVAMIIFLWMFLSLLRDLRVRSRLAPDEPWSVGLWAGGWGLAINGLFLHVWLDIPTALTFWTLAGIALAASPAREFARQDGLERGRVFGRDVAVILSR